MEAIQKKSNKTQYLYRQLCHIDKELNQLGPSGFPSPHSYSQALQQVQGMKGFLEDQLFTFSCVNQDEVTQKKYRNHSLKRKIVVLHVLARHLQTVSIYLFIFFHPEYTSLALNDQFLHFIFVYMCIFHLLYHYYFSQQNNAVATGHHFEPLGTLQGLLR